MTDEMNRSAFVGVFCQLGNQFLNPVFPAAVHTGGNCLPDGIGIIHLGGSAELDGFGISAAGQGCSFHFRPDPGNIFGNRHKQYFFLYLL
jgi:hypothetical protein